MQPRQSRGSTQPRSGGSASTAAQLSATGAPAAIAKAAAASSQPSKALASYGTSFDGADTSITTKTLANADHVWRWHLGYIYAGFGVINLLARLTGLFLWRLRYDPFVLPRVSDTQQVDLFSGQAAETSDLLRLIITGSNSVVRCASTFIILWHAFAHLRPAWGLRLMRWITPLFRTLLVLWVLADFMQAFVPNTSCPGFRSEYFRCPPDPAEHMITTPHIVFAQMAWYACAPTYFIILVVMFFDLDAGRPSLAVGMFTLLVTTFSFCYHTTYLFKGNAGKSTPAEWAVIIQVAFLTLNVGIAMPRRIIAMPCDLGRAWYHLTFLREGRVRIHEDTSARTGSKPLIPTGQHQADEKLDVDEGTFLTAINAQFRSFLGSLLVNRDKDAEPTKIDAKAAGDPANDTMADSESASSDALLLPGPLRASRHTEVCPSCGQTFKAAASKFCGKCGKKRPLLEAENVDV